MKLDNFNLKKSSQIIDSQYFGCINYYKNLFNYTDNIIEVFDNYQKMSFRNRCTLAGSNGLVDLSIPIVGGRKKKQLMRDVKIDYNQTWQQQHIKTIRSCYGKSPFFEYFILDIEKMLKCQHHFLLDLNQVIFFWVKKIIQLQANISFSEDFVVDYSLLDIFDNRNKYLPKNFQQQSDSVIYSQVFEDRIGFYPNLSILDILFCEGPNTKHLLKGNKIY
jgi:hypothetical protein